MSSPDPYDVVVAGCGPVGATAANLLGGLGLRVLVVERAVAIYDRPRAISADHEMLRALQLCGFAEPLAAMIEPHPGTVFLGVDRQPIRRLDPMPPPFPLGWLPTATFVQPELEAMLRAGLDRYPAVTLRLGWEVTGLHQSDAHATLDLAAVAGGATDRVTARYVLAADGGNSFLRRHLGIALDDMAFDEWWMVVDTWLRRPTDLPAKCVQYCWPERPATFILGPRDLRRWEIKLLPGEDPRGFDAPANIRRQLARFADPDALELWRAAVYRFHALVAAQWRADRVFLIGDAAHQTPPFMGQGLCAGMRDALNLCWKLAAVLRDDASPALLDSYEAERKPHVETVIALTKALGEVIGELDPAAALARDARLRDAGAEPIRQRLIPDLTAGLIAPDNAGAGMLFVQPHVRHGQTVILLEETLPPGWLLVSAEAPPQAWSDDAALARLGATRLILSTAPTAHSSALCRAATTSLFADWLHVRDAAIALVRPDRIVFGTARDPAGLDALLKQGSTFFFEKKNQKTFNT